MRGTTSMGVNGPEIDNYLGQCDKYEQVVVNMTKMSDRYNWHRKCLGINNCRFVKFIQEERCIKITIANCSYIDIKVDKCISGVELHNCKHCSVSYSKYIPSLQVDSCSNITFHMHSDSMDNFSFISSRSSDIAVDFFGKKHFMPDIFSKNEVITFTDFNTIRAENAKTIIKKAAHPKCIDILGDIEIITQN
ncbi:adenylyl cyclase-associated protein [Acrasis kona]|uniref:Adenylyl cyclase-associated protein n=1 Tax=Acrasis kona TaxID=1008807 RepID=A0AAW2YUX9_9EUKA